mmetsp:Transcript_8062/g.22678  ORF Transcript_8062/g.22678 Transcript_8062/m.22678 type:complete len:203 (+) Transcript_8062:164-772(+)
MSRPSMLASLSQSPGPVEGCGTGAKEATPEVRPPPEARRLPAGSDEAAGAAELALLLLRCGSDCGSTPAACMPLMSLSASLPPPVSRRLLLELLMPSISSPHPNPGVPLSLMSSRRCAGSGLGTSWGGPDHACTGAWSPLHGIADDLRTSWYARGGILPPPPGAQAWSLLPEPRYEALPEPGAGTPAAEPEEPAWSLLPLPA